MATFSLKRFTRPAALKAIRADHLVALLAPHAKFFADRDVPLPSKGSKTEPNYEGLAKVFMMPDVDTPAELANTLYFVHEMATTDAMDGLLDECDRLGIKLDPAPDRSPADIAVQVWLHDPNLLQRKHAEQYINRPRSFEYFQTLARPVPKFRTPSPATLAALEKDLDDWFEKKRRGRGARVFVYPRSDAVWFLVRHGQPFERKGVIKDGESSSLYFRGEVHDVLAYDRSLGELRMHAASKGEKETYRKKFGEHLFGDANFFPGTAKYTLEPLRTDGEKSLVCADVEGMEWVKLKQIEFFHGGPEKEIEVRKATDLFASYGARGKSLPAKARIIRASFNVKFKDAKTPRTVTIRPSNVTQYARDEDSTVAEKWLGNRGFILHDR